MPNQLIRNSGWTKARLGDYVYKTEEQERNPGEVGLDKFIKVEHLDPDRLKIERWGNIADEDLPPTFYKVFRAGQILYPTRNPHLRRVAYAKFDGICGEKTLTLSAKPEIAADFLPFIFQTEDFIDYATSMMIGSTNPHVRWRDIAAYEFLLPPTDVQKRIAQILCSADDVIENYLCTFKELQKLIDTFGYNNFLMHEARKQKPNMPEGWAVGTLSKLVGIDPKMPKDISDELEISFIPMESVLDTGEIANADTRWLKDVKKGYTYFAEGDILFAKITPCMENNKGAIALGLKNHVGMGSTEFFVFRAKNKADQHFVYYLTMSKAYRKAAERWMQGSAGQRRVPKDFFTKRPIIIPPESERARIGKALFAIDQRSREISSHYNLAKAAKMKLLNSFLSH